MLVVAAAAATSAGVPGHTLAGAIPCICRFQMLVALPLLPPAGADVPTCNGDRNVGQVLHVTALTSFGTPGHSRRLLCNQPAVAAVVQNQIARLAASKIRAVAAYRPHGHTRAACPSHLYNVGCCLVSIFQEAVCILQEEGSWHEGTANSKMPSAATLKHMHTFDSLKHRCTVFWRGRHFPGAPCTAEGDHGWQRLKANILQTGQPIRLSGCMEHCDCAHLAFVSLAPLESGCWDWRSQVAGLRKS